MDASRDVYRPKKTLLATASYAGRPRGAGSDCSRCWPRPAGRPLKMLIDSIAVKSYRYAGRGKGQGEQNLYTVFLTVLTPRNQE
jgi:hypothetical protein